MLCKSEQDLLDDGYKKDEITMGTDGCYYPKEMLEHHNFETSVIFPTIVLVVGALFWFFTPHSWSPSKNSENMTVLFMTAERPSSVQTESFNTALYNSSINRVCDEAEKYIISKYNVAPEGITILGVVPTNLKDHRSKTHDKKHP